MAAPTPVKVSTITAIGSIGTPVNLDALFELSDVVAKDDTSEGFVYVECGKKHGPMRHKGFHRKLTSRKATQKQQQSEDRAAATLRRFDNQNTIVLRMRDERLGEYVTVNIKMFANGKVQMTGLRYEEHGARAIEQLIARIPVGALLPGNPAPKVQGYRVCLINCDFSLGCQVRREQLFQLMQRHYPGIVCDFEPCIYPGVKVRYNCNTLPPDGAKHVDGVCACTVRCNGKGDGHGNAQCKKITISVFESGCVIVTGGQSSDQVQAAYAFICGVVQRHMRDVERIKRRVPPSTRPALH